MGRTRVPHLELRGRIFYFRRAIPDNLKQQFGRSTFRVSLATSDRDVAVLRCRRLSLGLEHLIALVRTMPSLTAQRIDDIIKDVFVAKLREANEIVFLGPDDPTFDRLAEADAMRAEIPQVQKNLANQVFHPSVHVEAEEQIEKHSLGPVRRTSEVYLQLCTGIARAAIEQRRILVGLLEGDPGALQPRDPLFAGLVTTDLPPLPGQHDITQEASLDAVVGKYIGTQAAQGWTDKTTDEKEKILKRFAGGAGPDRDINSIRSEDVRKYRDEIVAGYTLAPSDANTASAQKKSVTPPAPGTVQKYLSCVKAFFSWCVDEEIIAENPASKVKLTKKPSTKDARDSFSETQLKAFFTSPQYAGHKSPHRRSEPGKSLVKDAKYWIPLVAHYTGMRLGEIVGLTAEDIRIESDVLIIDVNETTGDGKHLKSSSSKRIIPIHPELLAMGFDDLVEERSRQLGISWLFHDASSGRKPSATAARFSKYFGRYMKAIAAASPKTAFHSFRHNFKDALVAGGVEDSHIRQLLGHSDSSTTSIYGSAVDANSLMKSIEAAKFTVNAHQLAGASDNE